jgi:hypothetical protein
MADLFEQELFVHRPDQLGAGGTLTDGARHQRSRA